MTQQLLYNLVEVVKMSGGMFLFIFFVGGALYLLMEHPFMFWLVALPLFLLIVGSIINWIRKG